MDGLLSVRYCGKKKSESWTRSEELPGPTSCTQGRRFFYYPHGIYFRGLHRKKKLFEYGMRTSFVPIWDQINKE